MIIETITDKEADMRLIEHKRKVRLYNKRVQKRRKAVKKIGKFILFSITVLLLVGVVL